MKILIITEKDFDDEEGMYPYYRLIEEGYDVDIAAEKTGEILAKYHSKLIANKTVNEVVVSDYDALYLPGGKAPEKLRLNENVIDIVKEMYELQKPISAICHGQQILISADILRGVKCTAYPGIKKDIENAGAFYLDEKVVVDKNIVTSRRPCDLPYLMKEFIKKINGVVENEKNI